jgi:hypothetical protein
MSEFIKRNEQKTDMILEQLLKNLQTTLQEIGEKRLELDDRLH